MKKVFYLTLVIAAVVFAGCKDNKTKNAGQVAKQHMEHLKAGNYDRFVECMAFDVSMPVEEVQAQKAAYKKALHHRIDPVVAEKGGLSEVKVISEKASPDGTRATVELENTYNNGQKEKYTTDLVWVGDEWKLDMDKHREVWHTKTADGRDLTLKLKDYDDREIFKEKIEGEGKEVVKFIDENGKEIIKVKADGEKMVEKVKDGAEKKVMKIKEDGNKVVDKVIEKGDETVIKHIENGEKKVEHIEK